LRRRIARFTFFDADLPYFATAASSAYLSPDRVVDLARVFMGPAFLVSLVLSPADLVAACFGCRAPRPAPLFTDFRPGFSAGASTLFLG